MSCALTSSWTNECRDNFGGIEELKIKILPASLSTYTNTSGVITGTGAALTGWYTISQFPEIASFSEKTTVDPVAGTVFYEQEVKFALHKLRAAVANEIKMYAANRVQIAIKDKNGTFWLAGYQYGLDLVESTNATGTAAGDKNGYDFTFKGKEKEPHINMTSATYATLITA